MQNTCSWEQSEDAFSRKLFDLIFQTQPFCLFTYWIGAWLMVAICFFPSPYTHLFLIISNAEICSVDCGTHGVCMGGTCRCEEGWTGPSCNQRACHPRCAEHGTCKDGKCECSQGWNGEHCTIGKMAVLSHPLSMLHLKSQSYWPCLNWKCSALKLLSSKGIFSLVSLCKVQYLIFFKRKWLYNGLSVLYRYLAPDGRGKNYPPLGFCLYVFALTPIEGEVIFL